MGNVKKKREECVFLFLTVASTIEKLDCLYQYTESPRVHQLHTT